MILICQNYAKNFNKVYFENCKTVRVRQNVEHFLGIHFHRHFDVNKVGR